MPALAQQASAECTYRLEWPEVSVRVTSSMRVDVTGEGYDVVIDTDAFDREELVSHREWAQRFPR